MIILPSLTYTFLFIEGWKNVLFELLGVKLLKRQKVSKARSPIVCTEKSWAQTFTRRSRRETGRHQGWGRSRTGERYVRSSAVSPPSPCLLVSSCLVVCLSSYTSRFSRCCICCLVVTQRRLSWVLICFQKWRTRHTSITVSSEVSPDIGSCTQLVPKLSEADAIRNDINTTANQKIQNDIHTTANQNGRGRARGRI